MIVAALAILGPLAAALPILIFRRRPELLAVAGAAAGAAGALATLVRVADGARYAASFPGLPGLPLRLAALPLTALLSAAVSSVSLCVLLYATGYMAGERDRPRFFAAMLLFVAAMQTLVLAGDWLIFLAAWELIGLASYLLIGFWFERPGVAGAATRAFATTRAMDIGLYLGVFALVTKTGTSEIATTLGVDGRTATLAGLAFLIAAMGKSAQAPMQGWLLDAMAGPTPVSALLHSATLVVAGVVLLIRAHPLLPDNVLLAVGLVGGATALVAGIAAIGQRDLKRMLAASTASQLGLMLLALGAGSPVAALVHLIANAAMKSTLFLAAGVFQHQRESTELGRLGGAGRERRAAFAAFVIAGLALAGVPPLAGFWTKDSVIAAALDGRHSGLLTPLAVAGSALTGVYLAGAIRVLWQPAAGERRAAEGTLPGLGVMYAGLAVVALLAATLGLAIPPISRLLDTNVPERAAALVLGLGAAAAGLAAGWLVPPPRLLGPLSNPARDAFRIDGGFAGLVVRPALSFAAALDRLDRSIHRVVLGVARTGMGLASIAGKVDTALHGGVVEGAGRTGLAVARATRQTDEQGIDGLIGGLVVQVRGLGRQARRVQTGLVHRELLVAAGGAIGVLAIVLLT